MPSLRPTSPSFARPVLTLAALLSGPAHAQTLALSAAAGISGRLQPAVSVGVTLRNVSLFGGYGLSPRLVGDIGEGGGLELSGLVDLPLNTVSERLTLYGGPGLALTLARPLRLRPSLSAGLNYDLDGQLGLFGEASYQWQGQFRVRAGVVYSY